MTPHRQHLTDEQRAIIKNDYLAGQKPAAIATKIGAKAATVRQAIWRQKLTDERNEIKEAAARTAGEVLEDARRRHAEKLTGIMDKQVESLEIDSEKLRDGWAWVQDAAGASLLMRAKALYQDRTLRHFGFNSGEASGPTANVTIGMFNVRGERPEKTVTAAAAD